MIYVTKGQVSVGSFLGRILFGILALDTGHFSLLVLVVTRCERIGGIYCSAPGPFRHFEARSFLRYSHEARKLLLSWKAFVRSMPPSLTDRAVNTSSTIITVHHLIDHPPLPFYTRTSILFQYSVQSLTIRLSKSSFIRHESSLECLPFILFVRDRGFLYNNLITVVIHSQMRANALQVLIML